MPKPSQSSRHRFRHSWTRWRRWSRWRRKRVEEPRRINAVRRFLLQRSLQPVASTVTRNPLTRSRAMRGPRGLIFATLFALVGLVIVTGRRYVMQSIDVERILRSELIPQLEREIGKPIEVGRIETDWLSRIRIYDIVVGRDRRSPFGALLQAKSAQIYVDPIGLALGRLTPLEAMQGVVLDRPQVYLRRDERGRLNLLELIKKRQGPPGARWAGFIQATNGRIYAEDVAFRSATGRHLLVDAHDVSANVRLNGNQPVNIQVLLPRTYLAGERGAIRNIALSGDVDVDGKWALANAEIPALPAPLLADFAFRRNEVVLTQGAFGARVQIGHDAAAPVAEQWLIRGNLSAQNVAGYAQALREPNTTRPLQIANLNGAVDFNNRAATIQNLSLQTLNSPWRLTGGVAIPEPFFPARAARPIQPILNLNLATSGADTSRLLRLLPPNVTRQFQLAAGRTRGALQLRGGLNAPQIRGELTLPNVTLASSRAGRLRMAALSTQFQANVRLRNNNIEAATGRVNLTAPNVAVNAARFAGSSRAVQSTLDFAATLRNRTLNLSSDGTFAFTGLSGGDGAANTRAGNLRGNFEAALSNGHTQVISNFAAANLNVAAPRTGSARAAHLRGTLRATLAGAQSRGILSIRSTGFAASAPRLASAQSSALDGAFWFAGDVARTVRAGGDFTLRGFTVRENRYGTLRGQTLRLATTSDNLQLSRLAQARWRGQLAFGRLDVSGIQLARLSPQVAQQVQAVDGISGQLRFADVALGSLGRNQSTLPDVQGNLRVAGATIANNRVRDARANFALQDGVLRVRGAQTETEAGALLANIEADLRSNTGRFSFSAPRVVLDAERINPYLAASGLQASGQVIGRLEVRNINGALNAFQTNFDLTLPSGRVRTLDFSRRAPEANQRQLLAPNQTLEVRGARLVGSGLARVGNNQALRFNGTTQMFAAQAKVLSTGTRSTAPALPVWLSGSTISNLRLTAQGGVTRTARGLTPSIKGTVQLGRVVLPVLPSARNQSTLTLTSPAAGTQPVLSDLTLAFDSSQPSGAVQVEVPRLAARIGSGRIDGHLTVRRNGLVAGQLLASRLNAGDLQRWIGSDFGAFSRGRALPATATRSDVGVKGTAFARVDVSGTLSNLRADVQARLLNGSVSAADMTLPIDSARADMTLQWPLQQTIALDELVVWSRGGRASLRGNVTQQANTWDLNLAATINGLRLREARVIPALSQAMEAGGIDGLTNAEVQVSGTLQNPRVEGRTRLRLARAFGLDIEEAAARVLWETRNGQPRLQLTELSGRVENSPFSGALEADFAANTWSLQFNTQDVAGNRLIRVADGLPTQGEKISDLPLRGTLNADINISGTLRDSNGRFAIDPKSGTVSLETGALRWRGREIGTVSADMVLEDEILQIVGLQLWGTNRSPAEQTLIEAGVTANQSTLREASASLVRLTGAIPLHSDAEGLDARIISEDARISVLLRAVEEIQTFLSQRGRPVPALNNAVQAINGLPSGVEGRVALDARLSGSLAHPVVAVERMVVRDAVFPYAGGQQRLPTLDAAFAYQPDENAIVINKAELLLTKAEDEKADEAEDDTVFRLYEGGRIELGGAVDIQGELLNANLLQIADYVPVLRSVDGTPIVGGEISQFQFDVRGLASSPTVTGSLVADKLAYRENSIDKLRVSRFSIGDGQFLIEPGKLTIVKGAFQSSAAWGRIPWTWGGDGEMLGPRRDARLEVHFPLGEKDFGALAGVFVPAITNVEAEAFQGNLNLTGTLNNPQIGGELSIKNGRLRIDPAVLPFDVGLTGLSGTIRVVNGRQIQIDPVDFVRGKVVPGGTVSAVTTGNPSASQRDPVAAARRERRGDVVTNIGGEFALRGGVTLELDRENRETRRILDNPETWLAAHRYNLQFAVDNALFVSEDISGLRDISAGIVWQTRGDTPATGQNLRWIITAQGGVPARKRQSPGVLYSYASLDLPANFATGAEALGRSTFQPFTDISGFEELPVLQKLATLKKLPNTAALAQLDDARSQLRLDALQFNVLNMGRGVLEGALFFDNEVADAPAPALNQPRPSLATRLAAARPQVIDTPVTARPKYFSDAPTITRSRATPRLVQNDNGAATRPVRISGEVVLSQAQIAGIPGGAEGGGPAQLPNLPVLDITASIGRDVEIVTPNLRAEIAGAADIGGTPRNLLIAGTFATRTGQIRFPTAVARLTNGEIALNVARDPVTNMLRTSATIDATARGQAGRYQITLTLRGPLDLGAQNTQDLRVDVTSNPPLSQDEAFAQLFGTAGRDRFALGSDTTADDGGPSSGTYARAVLSLVSAPIFSGIERSIEQLFGLTSVTFEYRFNEPLYIQVGKAIGDRVYVTYRRSLSNVNAGNVTAAPPTTAGGRLFAPSNQTLRIEYRIKGDYQLSFQGDDFRKQFALEKTWRF
jgi:hypothetical protein